MSDAEEVPYQCTVEGGESSNTSRGVTGKVTIQYPNGDKYEGLLKNGVPTPIHYLTHQCREGEGTYTYKDQSQFVGKFKNNEKDGIGRMSYTGKGEYHGKH